MKLSNEQISIIASNILISDIKKYIQLHEKEFKEFLKHKNIKTKNR